MLCFNFLKCCKGDTGVDLDHLPSARAIELKKPSTKRVTLCSPMSTRPIPELEVSPSSSTSLAMFDFEAMISVPCGTNSFTDQDNFEDVDLSSSVTFSTPPIQARKFLSSPFEDHYEVGYNQAITCTNYSNDGGDSFASSPCSTAPSALFEQPSRINSYDTCPSPFSDEHEVENDVEYAPTSPASNSEYTQRAMEYQRGESLFLSMHFETYEHSLLTTA